MTSDKRRINLSIYQFHIYRVPVNYFFLKITGVASQRRCGSPETKCSTSTGCFPEKVASAFAMIVGFKEGKISHEHIYWHQAGVLVQLVLQDPTGLPVCGAESAEKVIDPTLPPRVIN